MKNIIKFFAGKIGWERLSYPVPFYANTFAYSLGGITLIERTVRNLLSYLCKKFLISL